MRRVTGLGDGHVSTLELKDALLKPRDPKLIAFAELLRGQYTRLEDAWADLAATQEIQQGDWCAAQPVDDGSN